jgi:hypothetical protein
MCRYLYFVERDSEDKNDRLSKVRFALDYLNKQCQRMYTPNEDIAIDESLVKCRGTLAFLQFSPTKRALV